MRGASPAFAEERTTSYYTLRKWVGKTVMAGENLGCWPRFRELSLRANLGTDLRATSQGKACKARERGAPFCDGFDEANDRANRATCGLMGAS
jgi:hypothetical protein